MQPSGTLRLSAVLLAGLMAGGFPVAGAARASQVKFEAGPAGELALHARGATTEQTLQALAAKVGFAVVIAGELPRRTTDLTLSLAPVEKLLHEILRGRNYALLYDGTSDALSRVIVLPQRRRGARMRRRADHRRSRAAVSRRGRWSFGPRRTASTRCRKRHPPRGAAASPRRSRRGRWWSGSSVSSAQAVRGELAPQGRAAHSQLCRGGGPASIVAQ